MNNIQVLRSKKGLVFDQTPINGSPGWIWMGGVYVEMRYYSRGEEQEWITLIEYIKRNNERKKAKALFLKRHPEELRKIIDSKKRSNRGNYSYLFGIPSV